jgi:hypothetical protein
MDSTFSRFEFRIVTHTVPNPRSNKFQLIQLDENHFAVAVGIVEMPSDLEYMSEAFKREFARYMVTEYGLGRTRYTIDSMAFIGYAEEDE